MAGSTALSKPVLLNRTDLLRFRFRLWKEILLISSHLTVFRFRDPVRILIQSGQWIRTRNPDPVGTLQDFSCQGLAVERILLISRHLTVKLQKKPQSRQSAKLSLQSSKLGLPHPLTRRRLCTPSPLGSGGKTHSLDGERWRGVVPVPMRGQTLCYSICIYVLCTRIKKASLSQGAQVPHRAGRLQHGRRGAHPNHEGGWVAGLWTGIDLMRIRIWIRIQHFFQLRSRSRSQCGSGSPVPDQRFDDQKFGKIYNWIFFFFDRKLQFSYP